MNRTLLFFASVLFLTCGAFAQHFTGNSSKPKKLVIIPYPPDTSGEENFCICKIVTYSLGNNMQRTDAIFAGNSPGTSLTKRYLLKNISYELKQALVFFDSYKVVNQFAAHVDCNILYKYLESRNEMINHYTMLSPAYVSR